MAVRRKELDSPVRYITAVIQLKQLIERLHAMHKRFVNGIFTHGRAVEALHGLRELLCVQRLFVCFYAKQKTVAFSRMQIVIIRCCYG